MGIMHRLTLPVLLALALTAIPASATTLRRAGLDELAASNPTIVLGEVVDAHSYWNAERTFILTDVRVAVIETIQGESVASELTVTLMGGTVGDLSSIILGGAQLIPGNAYVLFLGESDLPGAEKSLTVRDHCQGAFDVVVDKNNELRAVSQANGHPLVPDKLGYLDAAGGQQGFPLDAMIDNLRAAAAAR